MYAEELAPASLDDDGQQRQVNVDSGHKDLNNGEGYDLTNNLAEDPKEVNTVPEHIVKRVNR